MGNRITILLFFFYIAISSSVLSQTKLGCFLDYGETNASFGSTSRIALTGDFKFKGHGIYLAAQSDIKDDSYNAFSGGLVKINKEIKIKSQPIKVEGFFMFTPYGSIQHESNWGLLLHHNRKYFSIKLGTHFRTYDYNSSAEKKYNMPDNSIHENWNLLYLLQLYIKPLDHKWNAGIGMTNIDRFILNQETNPFFIASGNYKISTKLNWYAEALYKTSGIMNAHVDYFGYNFRTGIVWEL